ncbi:hypothetical protein quinque_011872 [Culex quinquefasciatus]
MSQAAINDLPVELLIEVLDHLRFNDRRTAEGVCTLWNSILTESRYLKKTVLHLGSYIGQGHDLNEIRHYPVVEFGDVTVAAVLDQIREFLFSEEVSSNLVAIHLTNFSQPMERIFEDPAGKKTLNLPKLEEIKFERCAKHSSEPKIIAPRLKCVELISHNSHYPGDLVMPFVEQIQEMNLYTSFKVSGQLLRNAKNLQNVNIDLPGEDAIKNLPELLQTSHNIHVLTIASSKFSINTLPSLENLQELNLLSIPAQRFTTGTHKLSLPKLWKLQTVMSAVKRFVVPNLKSLTLLGEVYTNLREPPIRHFFKQFAHQLEELDLLDLTLSKKCIRVVHSLVKLHSLMLCKVQVDEHEVGNLMDGLRSLRMARFVNCYPYTAECYYCNCAEYREFFEGLKDEYDYCGVSVTLDELECDQCMVNSFDSDF